MKYRFFIYALLGWCMEILWTGLYSLIKRDVCLPGNTSLWMFFIYGLAVFLEPLADALENRNILTRGLAYVLCIFAVEYATGWLLRSVLGSAPWNYSRSRFNIDELIRLDYAPAWFAAALAFERFQRWLRARDIFGLPARRSVPEQTLAADAGALADVGKTPALKRFDET